jgi:predicted nuclease of predicted toxin-antitoxin system
MNAQLPRLLVDQGLPRSTARLLRALGWDVGEIGMATALDEEIIRRGRDEGRIVVTLDADFHAILAREGAASPSVVRLRVQGLGGAELASLIQTVIGVCQDELARGAVVTADSARVKVRRLPLGP